MSLEKYHTPVLLKESVEALQIKPEGIYIDLTFGGGGHSKEILKQLTTGKLLAFDQDEDAVKNAELFYNNPEFKDRFFFIHSNFRYFKNFLKYYKINKVSGILADLGVSSHQFDTAQRGFSYRMEGKPDMRMNKNIKTDAATIINTYSKEELIRIFKNYGEIDNAGRLVEMIITEREKKTVETISELAEIIVKIAPKGKDYKYSSQVYQALRIEVNSEIEALESFLIQTPDVLEKGGRLVVISYHSLEDRPVKNFMKSGNLQGELIKDVFGVIQSPFEPSSNKIITPSQEELNINSRAASAKMRIAQKK